MGGAGSAYGERRGVYRVFVRKPDDKRPLGRPRHRWKDNIKTSSGSGMRGYELGQVGSGKGQVTGTCESGNEPWGSMKCREFLD